MMEISSGMQEQIPDLNLRIARQIRDLRAAQSLSLDALATRSGVSRSMISLIERAESSPTAIVLEKLATALGVTLAAIFDPPESPSAPSPLARRADQPEWVDPGSGYRRRNVSPAGLGQPMRIVEVHFPPGGRVAFDNLERLHAVQQQVWLLEGRIEVAVGTDRYWLEPGDCLAMSLDKPTGFHNPTAEPARYAVVISDQNKPQKP
jgi:transcriptional regulator with XRE-family HTH domain